jgi:hypothetical protein
MVGGVSDFRISKQDLKPARYQQNLQDQNLSVSLDQIPAYGGITSFITS